MLPDDFLVGNVSLTLRSLYLKNNKLTDILQCLLQTKVPGAISELEILDLSYSNIKELPAELFNSSNWSNLREIDLSLNKFETLPNFIFYSPILINLRTFNFSHNKLTFLHDKLFHSPYLQNLREIDFSHNHITSVPSRLLSNQALENVEKIHLNNNNIKAVSKSILPSKSYHLCVFNLANNNISSLDKTIPKVLRNMNLQAGYKYDECKLDVSNNSLTVQVTNFILSKTKKENFTINGKLILSFNKINKFEVISNFGNKLPYIAIPVGRKWLYSSGNQIFSVLNLLKAALDLDLNNISDHGLQRQKFTPTEILRLHVLIKA